MGNGLNYKLQDWNIVISNHGSVKFNIICDKSVLAILNVKRDFLFLIKINDKGELLIQRPSYLIQYEAVASEKKLIIHIKA